MQYGKIDGYKITATCRKITDDCTVEIPDEAELFDYYIDGVLYLARDYADKMPVLVDGKVVWSDDPVSISAKIQKQIATIDNQISDLESKTYRPLREISLGLDTDGTAQAKLSELNTQIAELRTKRATLSAQLN